MHGYRSLSEAVAYEEALHVEKVKAEESQAENVSDLRVKVKAVKANTAPTGRRGERMRSIGVCRLDPQGQRQ